MGKYTDQASAYSQGMRMVVASLEKAKTSVEKASSIVSNEDSKDILNYHVSNFNDEIKGMIDSLILKCTALPTQVMKKAREIDWRIQQEQEALRRRQEEEAKARELAQETQIDETNDIALKKELDDVIRKGKTDISNKVVWK